jgi:hypothetical protein
MAQVKLDACHRAFATCTFRSLLFHRSQTLFGNALVGAIPLPPFRLPLRVLFTPPHEISPFR